MEISTNLNEIQKEAHQTFDFFINKLEDEKTKTYIEEILGMPKLPMIGHYNGNEYSLGSILSLVCFQLDICQGDNNDQISSNYSDFKLPNNIKDYLNVNEELDIDNNTKNKGKAKSIFYPKKKLNFYFIISALPIEYNPKKKDKDENDKSKIYNIVPHLYYNKDNDIDFSKIKRFVFEKALCLFDMDKNEKNDISYVKKDKNDISINDLRIEYSSLHLKKGSLAFSPNNLKFKLDISNLLSQFYLIMNIKENDYHSVFYYITCNNDKSEVDMKKILNKSNNIKDIVTNIKTDFPDSKNIYENLSKLFSIE